MTLSLIKDKYKSIVQDPNQDQVQSEDEWEQAYSRMKNKRKSHILGESKILNQSSISSNHGYNEENFLKNKEKLAQVLTNLKKKDCEIQDLKSENLKAGEQIKMFEQQVLELKDSLSKAEQKIMEQKVAFSCLEKTVEGLERNVTQVKMDKELLQRQIQYYRLQIQSMKKQQEQNLIQISNLKKESKVAQKTKIINLKLKEDVERLVKLLGQTEKYKDLASKLQNKHFLGRPSRQSEGWISDDIVSSVEIFLKKQQIGNKEFCRNLIKFVSRHVQEAKEQGMKKAKRVYTSKMKQHQRKQNYSLNFKNLREDRWLRGNSLAKSRLNTINLNEDKHKNDTIIYQKLEKSSLSFSSPLNPSSREVCLQILSSFRKTIIQLVYEKELKRKKMMKIIDWAIEGVMSVFPRTNLHTFTEPDEDDFDINAIKIDH